MGNDRVASVDDPGVIAAFVEHTHVKSQHVGEEDSAGHTALIRADDHHVIAIDLQLFLIFQQIFDKLVNRLNGLKTLERNRVLDTRIVCVKGNDILNAHIYQLLQCQRAV